MVSKLYGRVKANAKGPPVLFGIVTRILREVHALRVSYAWRGEGDGETELQLFVTASS